MKSLGDKALEMRKDFLVVNLHPKCFHCEKYIVDPERYRCSLSRENNNKTYVLCGPCYNALPDTSKKLDKKNILLRNSVSDILTEEMRKLTVIKDYSTEWPPPEQKAPKDGKDGKEKKEEGEVKEDKEKKDDVKKGDDKVDVKAEKDTKDDKKDAKEDGKEKKDEKKDDKKEEDEDKDKKDKKDTKTKKDTKKKNDKMKKQEKDDTKKDDTKDKVDEDGDITMSDMGPPSTSSSSSSSSSSKKPVDPIKLAKEKKAKEAAQLLIAPIPIIPTWKGVRKFVKEVLPR